ncbi:MAG: hypothetical protein LBU06_03155 [Desulfovibrio sp.]|jgi:hypothetical protein|nr:hypothetical protein [Desulfovibrio sp.]
MAFTEKDIQEQDRALAGLKDEWSRLNARFDGLLKDARITADDLRGALAEKLPPELEAALAKAKDDARQAGKARVAQAEGAGKADAPSGRGRSDAVRV